MKLLQNKVAIITGASRGIGKGIAEKFAEQGCNIAFTFLSSIEKAKAFLKTHPELQAYLIYSDEKGNYQIFETPGLKSIISEVEE